MAQMNVNTADLPDPDRMGPVPAGKYAVQVIESDVVSLKTGNGESLNITLEVIEGEFVGRKIWDRMNFRHTNEIAQKIGQQAVKSICKSVGFEGHLSDSEVLHGIPMIAKVIVEQKDQNYEPKNVVKGYEALDNSQPVQQAAPQQAAPRAAVAAQTNARPPMASANVSGGARPGFMNRRG